jgi:hypothetical protein
VKLILIALVAATALVGGWQAVSPPPTQVVRFSPPATLPERAQSGSCQSPSQVAAYRDDAFRCTVEKTTFDPCFTTVKSGQVWCAADPRKPAVGTLVSFPSLGSNASGVPVDRAHAWFIELTDGSTCQPLVGVGREIDGLSEIYTCRFGPLGDADAVLGDLDASTAVWTIRKAMINKKVEPQTIKAVTIAAVKAVWQ